MAELDILTEHKNIDGIGMVDDSYSCDFLIVFGSDVFTRDVVEK